MENEVNAASGEPGEVFDSESKRKKSQAQIRKQTRLRVQAFRERQKAKPRGIEKKWTEHLTALSETDKVCLLAQKQHASDLQADMNSVIDGVGYGNGRGVAGPDGTMPYPDLLYLAVKEFIAGHELVNFWIPDLLANELMAADWKMCDDPVYRECGLRTRIVKLFFCEFLANAFLWCEAHPEEAEPGIAAEITQLLASLQPIPTPKYIPGSPPLFVSENAREKAMLDKQTAEEYRQREIENYEHWQLKQLGKIESGSINPQEDSWQ